MLRLVGRRAATAAPLLLALSFVVFALVALTPGDPAAVLAGEDASASDIEAVRLRLGLDQPFLVRYGHWLWSALHGDLGSSLTTGQPVTAMIGSKLEITASLVALAMLVTVVVGTSLGVLASLRAGGLLDRVTTMLGSVAMAVPPAWLALVLIVSLAVQRHVFPAIGYAPLQDGVGTWFHHLVLPVVVLCLLPVTELMMQLKTALQDTLRADYIVAARAKGLRRGAVVLKHGLRNAAVPVVTVLGFRAAQLIGGTTVVETAFSLNGLGSMALRATLGRDVTVLLGIVIVGAVAVIVINVLVDISYGILNPKVRQ